MIRSPPLTAAVEIPIAEPTTLAHMMNWARAMDQLHSSSEPGLASAAVEEMAGLPSIKPRLV